MTIEIREAEQSMVSTYLDLEMVGALCGVRQSEIQMLSQIFQQVMFDKLLVVGTANEL
jgi:hypothetical protein